MKIRNWPSTTEEARRRVIELARRADRQRQVAHVRFLARKDRKLVPLFGRIDLARKGDLETPPRYESQDILTLSEAMSVPDFIGRLDRAMAGSPFTCNDHILEDHGMTGQWLHAEHPRGEYSRWPTSAVYVDAHTEAPPPVDSPILVRTGKVFDDLEQLRAAFAQFSMDHLHCDARRNKILIVFRDYRGRIELVKDDLPHTLSVQVGGDRIEDLKLTGQVETATGPVPIGYCGESEIQIALSSAPRSVELNLVLGVDTIIDRLRESLSGSEDSREDDLPHPARPEGLISIATYQFHPQILEVSASLFSSRAYAQAVFEACKRVIREVKNVAALGGLKGVDGEKLMNRALSPENGVIRFNSLSNDGEVDEQRGFMNLFKGIVGIRNLKAHENVFLKDQDKATEYLALCSLLMRLLEERVEPLETEQDPQLSAGC